ncbi:MAG: GNAT family N-acetyltransferase [Parvibaculaceae bacterium]
MSQTRELLTKRFRLSPLSPDKVSDSWMKWTGDPLLMSQLNARVMKPSRADLQRYVAAAWQNKRILVGIYSRRDADHVGLYEAAVDARHANVTLDVLVDPQRYVLSNVLTETDPVLLDFFVKQYRIEKVIAKVVETNAPLIRHYEATGWLKEGILRQEVQSVAGNGRLDVVQFCRLYC